MGHKIWLTQEADAKSWSSLKHSRCNRQKSSHHGRDESRQEFPKVLNRERQPHNQLRLFVFDNGQSNIVSGRPRRLAYGRRIRCMRRRVIVDLAFAGPLEVKFIITLRRSTPVIEYRRFELGPPGESKLPLSNRKYTDFLKILNNKNFYKFLDFYRRFRVLLHYY